MYILHMSDGELDGEVIYDVCPEEYVIEDVVRDWCIVNRRDVGGSFNVVWFVRCGGELVIGGSFMIDISARGSFVKL